MQICKKRIVFVGRLVFNKGIQFIIECAPGVLKEHPDAKFIIIGTGPLESKIRKRASELHVLDSFEFLGNVPSVADIMRECDIFIRPSLTEATSGGLAALEAMACGLPVVVTKIPGIDEVIINNETGILIEPGDPKQLTDALLRLLDNCELIKRIGNNARLFVEKRYSWDKTVELTLQLYRNVITMYNKKGLID